MFTSAKVIQRCGLLSYNVPQSPRERRGERRIRLSSAKSMKRFRLRRRQTANSRFLPSCNKPLAACLWPSATTTPSGTNGLQKFAVETIKLTEDFVGQWHWTYSNDDCPELGIENINPAQEMHKAKRVTSHVPSRNVTKTREVS